MDRLPPAPRPKPPGRPHNALHTVSQGISRVVSLPSQGINLLNEGFANATNAVAQALPSFPAATLGSMAIGIPHAHVGHPPSAPLNIPLPVIGMVALGTSVQVLINGLPAARCGDIGFNPTCCGLPPLFEIFTGSSKVFIGGARAARMLDITYHCKITPDPGCVSRGVALAMKAVATAAMVAGVAGKVAQVAGIAGDAIEADSAAAEGDAAMASAMGMSAGMAAAQMAADAAAMALRATMGMDPCLPPGTLGAIILGSPNVLIGGFPMPSWMNIARGLMRLVPGLRSRMGGMTGRAGVG